MSSELRKPFKAQRANNNWIPNPNFNVFNASSISTSMALARGVKLAMFTGSMGNRGGIGHLSEMEKRQVAMNFSPQADLVNGFKKVGFSETHDLVVTEGIYKPESTEKLTPNGLKHKATKGRVVVYEVHGPGGMDPIKTVEVAEYWKDMHLFDELILSYDTLDPHQTAVNAEIIVVMPEINSFPVSFKRNVSSTYNYMPLARDALASISNLSPNVMYNNAGILSTKDTNETIDG